VTPGLRRAEAREAGAVLMAPWVIEKLLPFFASFERAAENMVEVSQTYRKTIVTFNPLWQNF
jgi:hypothetical protein